MITMVIHEHALVFSWHLVVPHPLLYLYQKISIEKNILKSKRSGSKATDLQDDSMQHLLQF